MMRAEINFCQREEKKDTIAETKYVDKRYLYGGKDDPLSLHLYTYCGNDGSRGNKGRIY